MAYDDEISINELAKKAESMPIREVDPLSDNMQPINQWINKQWFIGISNDGNSVTIFPAYNTPTFLSHGEKYAFCHGGFKTRKAALEIAESTYRLYTLEG